MSGECAFRHEIRCDGHIDCFAKCVLPVERAETNQIESLRSFRVKISISKDSGSRIMSFVKREYTQYRHALAGNCLTSIFQAIHEESAISLFLTRWSTISRVLRAWPLTHNPVLHRNASCQVYNPLYPEVNENTARTCMAIRLPSRYKSDDRPKG